ncbi:hypothetical protein HYX07_02775 [Candidatus Woesearchaeota archaeon]|nr:hypothetical protein [Candidatus Woesearchaeota archaeon]
MTNLPFKTYQETVIDSPNFLIFVQGSWAPWNNPNNVAASRAITVKGIASVLLYDSRRDWSVTQGREVKWWQWIEAFDGKTYRDEAAELREKIEHVRKDYKPKNIFLSGNSYGGGLAALVSGDGIPELNRVLLFSPQISSPSADVNIYGDFPSWEEFSAAISRYSGELTVAHGNKDAVIGIEQSVRLFEAAKTQKLKRLVLLPTDHSFSNAANLYVKEHLIAFRS